VASHLGHDGAVHRPPVQLLVAALVGVLTLAGCSGSDSDSPDSPHSGGSAAAQTANPYAGRDGYPDPDSRTAQGAAQAKADGDTDTERVLDRLASIPQGIWLTPEQYAAGKVGPFVQGVVDAADKAGQVPTFVVYGIPDRDCSGGFSGGGLPADQYGPWVQEIADAAGHGERAAVVVEPDALASALECDRSAERVGLIKDAVGRFRADGVTTYVDGGHSHWIEPAKLADLLEQVGVEGVRGFATNVANYQTNEDEVAYAEKLSALVGGAHYIVDTGRNGFGSTDDWCNPSGRAFGTEPSASTDGEHLDAYAWIKPPAESDGECGGGPAAGELWPERAVELAAASGW
jgi:endoglucanase